MKFETARIHFLSDVFVVVAVSVTNGLLARNGHMGQKTLGLQTTQWGKKLKTTR